MEERSWLGGRLVIRITDQHGRAAEGFVSVASYADITLRAGAIGRRLFAVLAGTETPEDVAAIISWFYEDPRRLADMLPRASEVVSSDLGNSDDEAVVSAADLAGVNLPALTGRTSHEVREHRNWARFMEHIFSAFRQEREPLARTNPDTKTETEDEEGIEIGTAPDVEETAIEKSLSVFNRLFDLLLSDESNARNLMVAFDLTHYICGRLQPEMTRVKNWLQRLIPALVKASVPAERRDDVTATILLLAGTGSGANGYRWAREYVLRMNVDIGAGIPSMNGVSGFRAVLPQRVAATEVWAELQKIRTYPEQVRAYLHALNGDTASSDYGELARQALEEWPVLEDALTTAMARQRILVQDRWQECCPRCRISLPTSEVFKLRSLCVATAKNCCRRVILWTGA